MKGSGQAVLYGKEDGVAHVTLNRPEVLNAMNMAMHEELSAAWDDIEADAGVRVAVLTGAGNRSFSVGQDLKERAALDAGGGPRTSFGSVGRPGYPRLTERFRMSKPVIAKVRGYALGGGFELALACDVIVASQDAVFALPEGRLGLVPGAGGVFRLARQLPLKLAAGYLLTGRRIAAADAARFGLVNEVVPPADLDACAAAWARDIVRCAPLSVSAIKESMMRSVDMPLEDAFTASYAWEEIRRNSADPVEGVRAYIENRQPRWRGASSREMTDSREMAEEES